MEERPRTQKDFDNWFAQSNGDPWNYNCKSIKNRLDESLGFVKKYVPVDFTGNLIELGAFNGDFTLKLCNHFRFAKIFANDISEIAIIQAKEKLKSINNVTFVLQDLLNFNSGNIDGVKKETVIFLLECLYYLKEEERFPAIKNLKDNYPDAPLFCSAPIIGKPYFTEDSLILMMKHAGYYLENFKVLNLRKFGRFRYLLLPFANIFSAIRKAIANQVIYYFKPYEDKN
ncbi:MAG TPA: class I SAM-dependent methyltransferase [Ignavibacteriaceae bacterium]|nr:class I SAM-dependent methyltransferase [Ignavibacteriaceae bacterium]